MASKGLTLSGIAASLALAAVTLAVFSASQLRGPEGTIHQFIMAVHERDLQKINTLTFGSPREKGAVAGFVAEVLRAGGRYEVLGVTEQKGVARVGVLFRFPNRHELPWIVAVRKNEGRQWRIVTAASTTLGPGLTD